MAVEGNLVTLILSDKTLEGLIDDAINIAEEQFLPYKLNHQVGVCYSKTDSSYIVYVYANGAARRDSQYKTRNGVRARLRLLLKH